MSLIALDNAKRQLRIGDEADDADVYAKLQQAEAIILDYLKARSGKVATILTSSVASPTVITTEDPHTFVTGESVTIVDHEDSAPALDGTYMATIVTSTTFTVPVAITTAGTGGTATAAWTDATVPQPVASAVLVVLEDLYEHRPINWEAVSRLLMRLRDPAFA